MVAAEQAKEPDDRTLILADVGRKAIWQVEHFVQELLVRHMQPTHAKEIARILCTVPRGVHELMQLYPQPQGRRPSVEYIPSPRELPARRPKN